MYRSGTVSFRDKLSRRALLPLGPEMPREQVIDTLRERFDFDFERFYRAPGQRSGDQLGNIRQVGANALDRVFELVGRPQRFDPFGDVAKLLVEVGKIDRRFGRWQESRH